MPTGLSPPGTALSLVPNQHALRPDGNIIHDQYCVFAMLRSFKIPRSENLIYALRKCKFHTKNIKILHSENANFALKNCSKNIAQNSALRKGNSASKIWKIHAQKKEILRSENGKFLQCHEKPIRAILHYWQRLNALSAHLATV